MKIGHKIAKIRKENHLSRRQMAEKLHTHIYNIFGWEIGIIYPDIKIIKKLGDLDFDHIFEIESDEMQYKKFVYSIVISLVFVTISLLLTILLSDLKPDSVSNLNMFFAIHTLIIIASSLMVIVSVGLFVYNSMCFHNYLSKDFHHKTYNLSFLMWVVSYLIIFILDLVVVAIYINFM